jgi:hypothetical protein
MMKTQVYLVLGAHGSGRREVLADLISGGIEPGTSVACLLSDAETASEHDSKLGTLLRWAWTPQNTLAAQIPPDTDTLFFITDGRRNPVDQVEAFKAWLPAAEGELARVLCVVHCGLAQAHHELLAWYDACIHFSDVVLLNRREGLPNKWMSDFIDRYKSQYYPCLIDMVKAGRVKHPLLILEPQPRRISQVFEEDPVLTAYGVPVEITDEEDDEDGEDGEPSPDDENAAPTEDPYFARRPGGRRVRVLPDIATILKAVDPARPAE